MKPQRPRFSAIIPLHDKAATIAAAVKSVQTQTLPVEEIIIVDDASRDDGNAIVATIADRRITLLHRNDAGAGGYAARNLAVQHAKTEWVAFLDADDIWRKNHLEVLAHAIRLDPHLSIVATRYDHVFRDRREPDHVSSVLRRNPGPVSLNLSGFLEAWLATHHCPIWTGAVAMKRDLFDRVGGFPAGRAQRGGDKDLWLRAVAVGKFAFVPTSTADFHRDVEGKLTARVDTRAQPCLVETARELSATAPRRERRLLRRLANQEIELYARWTAASGGRCGMRLRDLTFPMSPSSIFTVLAIRLLPPGWLITAHQMLQRWRTRRYLKNRHHA